MQESNVFKKIDFSEIKKRTWDNESTVEASKINPRNLKYKILKDGSFEFFNDTGVDDIESFDRFKIIKDNIYLQLQLCNMYFYLTNFNIPLTSNLVCNALNMNEEDMNKICLLFESVVLDENYPMFKNNAIYKHIQALQVTGLSPKGIQTVKRLLKNNSTFNLLYNNRIINDITCTSFYKFENLQYNTHDNIYKDFVRQILENKYLKQCGSLNVSALSFDSLENHQLCLELSENTDELYLQSYDMKYNDNLVFVKYLQWY